MSTQAERKLWKIPKIIGSIDCGKFYVAITQLNDKGECQLTDRRNIIIGHAGSPARAWDAARYTCQINPKTNRSDTNLIRTG